MDETLRHRNPNPFIKANFLSKMFFWWLNPFFAKGYRRPLTTDDMYNVPREDSSDVLCTQLERQWEKEIVKLKNGGKPSLLKALIRTFGRRYMLLGLVTLVEESTKVGQPLLLGGLIRYFTPKSTVTQKEAFLYAMGLSLCSIVLAITHHPYFFGVQRIGMQIRVACCSLLYKKSLRLSNKALGETTTGQIVNLMSNDVNRFDQAVIFLHFLWVGPLQAIAVLIILWYELGPACLAGFGVLLLLIPVQGWMGKMFSRLRQKTATFTDERVRLMNEIITGMRVIKMYCWEIPFGKLVEQVRRQEVKVISSTNSFRGVNLTLFFTSGKATVLATLLVYVLLGNKLGAAEVFITIMLYNAVRLVMTLFFPFAVQSVAEGSVTIVRTEKFLVLDELETVSPSDKSPDRPNPTECGVTISSLTAKWDKNVEQNTLEDLSLEVESGKLLAVIGPVGAGKSSLLMSILGELPADKGEITVKGKISYTAQQPWVFSASLRQNIVFGQKYDSAKYEKIIKVCALQKDLDLMPHGDGTLIGDRGISLSGGQRARVSLARALYTDADVFLLDDPLSAVDAEVGRHIFEKVVMGYLKDKPRILVTHQLQFLTVADEILILKEGKTMGRGTFDELSQSGVDFSALLKRDDDNEKEDELQRTTSRLELMRSLSHMSQNSKHVSDVGSSLSLDTVDIDYEPEPVQLREEEEISKGTVNWKIYKDYFQAGANIFVFILLVLVNLIAQTSFIASDWWLSYWANQEEAKYAAVKERDELIGQGFSFNMTNVTIPDVDLTLNVSVFTAITVAVFLFGLLRALLFFRIAIAASRNLHNRMFSSILRSKIGFFDTNPVGRILNRFSKDVGHMDDNLPVTFFDFIQCALLILGIVVVAGAVNPWVFIPILPLTAAFLAIRHYYIKTSRNIKRLEGTSRSPVFSHLSASLQGLQTIRAFNVQEKFMEEFDSHQDLHSEAWFLFIASSRWLAVRLDWLCASFVACVAFCSVFAADNLDAGLVGLSLTYAMTLMGMFQWAVRQSAEVENQMVSVERVLEYSNLPAEAPLESDPDHCPPSDWPGHGVIKGQDVGLRYCDDSPLVLKHINFTINAKEKVGIVGRTGAGKSSLLTMLFRLVEPEGKVFIDEIDISKVGLHDLRQKISIIPQDPTLFTGSVRRNLDPFEQHDDPVLWSALAEVQLKSVIEELPEGLEWGVSEGGINFSVGQRQLLCLARAILRKNKILVIDEATANVDPRTDALIQETIRDKFAACTVLTIAHRLHTIMDSDRVMVLEEGQVVALDDPYVLLNEKTGVLYNMVEQTGRAETDNLTAMAKTAHDERVRRRNIEKNNPTSTNNGIPTPVTIKLNDLQLAPKASPESSNLDRVSKQRPTSLAEDGVPAANQTDRSIPNDTVTNSNQEPLLSKGSSADEQSESTEKDKLLKTGTISI